MQKNKPTLNGRAKRNYSYFWGGRRGAELHNNDQMDSRESRWNTLENHDTLMWRLIKSCKIFIDDLVKLGDL